MQPHYLENLSHDPIHGYICFTSPVAGSSPPEPSSAGPDHNATGVPVSEQTIIDHPWVQRLRQIHQLQTAWWVYPTAEHTRFQHVVGAMHLASRTVATLYDSLRESCPDTPSRGYVECLLRMAGLLHDVGHGPFGHFFDDHFLKHYGLTHETLGAYVIVEELGDLLRGLRYTPNNRLEPSEQLDPRQIAWLITRPHVGERPTAQHGPTAKQGPGGTGADSGNTGEDQPRWLHFLRGLLSGIYTIDNMDFVLRDAYMSGYSQRAYDLDRLLHYSFFSERGLTIHDRGIEALVRFMSVRAELFRSIYFHRTVRAIDLTLADLFADGKDLLFPGNPLERLDEYRELTEFSLLVDVSRWARSGDPRRAELGRRWQALLRRRIRWKMICQRNLVFSEKDGEQSSIFSDPKLVEHKLREMLPADLRDVPLRIDIARHLHRPHTRGATSGQNFLYDSAQRRIRPLTANELIDRLPVSHRICRIYAETQEHAAPLSAALDQLIGGGGSDDATNM